MGAGAGLGTGVVVYVHLLRKLLNKDQRANEDVGVLDISLKPASE